MSRDFDIERDMKNVIINGLEFEKTNKNPLTKEALKLVTAQFKKLFGPDYEMTNNDLDLASFGIYGFSYINNVNTLAYILVYAIWGFLIDDYLDINREDYEIWIKYIQDKNCTDTGKIGKILQLMITEYKELLSSEFIEEQLNLTKDWIKLAYSRDKHGQINMSDKVFLEMRILDADPLPFLSQIRYHCQLKENDELRGNPDWINFNEQALMHMVLVNEMYSLKKEIRDGFGKFNYVYIKMMNKKFKISAQESMDEIVAETKKCEALALEYGIKLKQLKNDYLEQYVDGLIQTMYGHAYVTTICKRFD